MNSISDDALEQYRQTQRGDIEPETIGNCEVCGGQIYDYELTGCDCGRKIHEGCIVQCAYCKETACKKCWTYDIEIGEWFCCDECLENYSKENEK